MQQALTIKAGGLNTATSDISKPAAGLLRRGLNIEVSREGLWMPRRGMALRSVDLSAYHGRIRYLGNYQGSQIAQFSDGKLVSIDPDDTVTLLSSSILEQPNPSELPLPYGRFRALEARRNLYLLARGGVYRLSGLPIPELYTPTIDPAGVPGGLDLQATLGSAGTAIEATSNAAYRCLFGTRDHWSNLLYGAPSGRSLIENSNAAAYNAGLVALVPTEARAAGYFWQVYRSASTGDLDIPASDEMALVYEAPVPLAYAKQISRTSNVATIVTLSAHGFTAGQTVNLASGFTGPAGFIGVGTNKCATSPDGVTWTARTIPAGDYWGVASNATIAVAVGYGTKCATSPDGVTWTSRTIPAGDYQAVVWTGSLFVAVGAAAACATSPDGITWTARTIPTGDYTSIVWTGSQLVAVGYAGKCATSPNGITWTARSVPSLYYTGITWTGSLLVAVSQDHFCATSPDGITWAQRTMPGSSGYNGVAWSGSILAAVGDASQCATSPDGITWTARTIPAGIYDGAAWNGSAFSATTNGTVAASSPDGVTWTARTIPTGTGNGIGLGPAVSVPAGDYVVTGTPTTTTFTFASTGSDFALSSFGYPLITSVTMVVTDVCPDTLRGQALYTNATQEGIGQQNDRPPDALDIASFKNTVFFAAPLRPPTLSVTLLSTDAASGGLASGDILTLPSGTLTAYTSEDISAGKFQVFTGGIPSQDISNTVASLVRVINRKGNLGVTAVVTSTDQGLPGQFSLISVSTLSSASFSTSAHATAWSPSSAQTVGPKRDLNVLAFSKLNLPEAVPALNTYAVGSADKQILRIIPLRDALIVLKEDGVWKLVGSSPADFAIYPLDLTCFLAAPESAVSLNNSIVALANQGVVQITDAKGTDVLSLDIDDKIQALLTPDALYQTKDQVWALGYESERRYTLWYASEGTDIDGALSYHLYRQAWTERDDVFDLAHVDPDDNRIYAALSLATGDTWAPALFVERKAGDRTDAADLQLGTAIAVSSISTDGLTLTLASIPAGLAAGDAVVQGALVATVISIVGLAVIVDHVEAFTATAVDLYQAIESTFEWSPNVGANPGLLQHWRELSILWHDGGLVTAQLSYTTDQNNTPQVVDLTAADLRFGPTVLQEQGRIIRTGIPWQMQRANQIHITLTLRNAYYLWSLQGLSVVFDATSERTK